MNKNYYIPLTHINECYKLITKKEISDIDENRYWISNYSGAIYDSKLNKFILPNANRVGYLLISLHTSKGRKTMLLHRVVGKCFIQGDTTLQINHKNGLKYDCSIDNLEWVTARDNIIHAVETGLQRRGETKPNAIITNDQARIVCECLLKRFRISDILNIIGLDNTPRNRDLIIDIKRRKTFTFISKDYNFDSDALCERELSNDQVVSICELFQANPSISYPEVFTILKFNTTTKEDRLRILGKIKSIKLRKAYTDISKYYIW